MTDIIAFFPGQGAQHVGMLADIAAENALVEDTFAEASESLNFDLWDMVQNGSVETLSLTQNTQPALLTASVALWRVVQSKKPHLNITAAAGHSLGEYSALVAANALSFKEAVRLVRTRGELMEAAVPEGQGTMAAILGLREKQLMAICAEASQVAPVDLANFNAPGQIVIAGATEGVTKAIDLAKEAGAKRALPLAVSGPFHSKLMKAAAEKFADALDAVSFCAPEFPVYHNVDNKPATLVNIPKHLLEQLYSPVNWIEAVEACRPTAELAVEFGPGKVLAGLNRRIDKSLETLTTGNTTALHATLEKL